MSFIELTCPLCKEGDFDNFGMALHFEDCETAQQLRQDFRIAQDERNADRMRDHEEWRHEAASAQRIK